VKLQRDTLTHYIGQYGTCRCLKGEDDYADNVEYSWLLPLDWYLANALLPAAPGGSPGHYQAWEAGRHSAVSCRGLGSADAGA